MSGNTTFTCVCEDDLSIDETGLICTSAGNEK